MELNIQPGEKALITTSAWFIAPDGKQYGAVFGTIKAVRSDKDTLGIQSNRNSTNWYVEIGRMTIAGCQIHYAVRCDSCNLGDVESWHSSAEQGCRTFTKPSSIFDADSVEVEADHVP